MKNLILVLLVAASVLLGGFYLWQRGHNTRQAARIAELETLVKRKEAEARKGTDADRRAKEFRDRLRHTAASAAQRASQLAQAEQERARAEAEKKLARQTKQAAAPAATNADAGSGFAAMFKSPEMREMIKAQQKLVLGPMLEQNYAALFRQLNLPDEQKNQLRALLEQRMLASTESGMELLGGDSDPAKREETMKKIKDDTEAMTAQIKQLLGDANYSQFESYEKTLPERMQLNQYNQTIAGSELQLKPEQEQQLLDAMAAERTGMNWAAGSAGQPQSADAVMEMFSEAGMNRFAEQKAQVDQRVLARAQGILTPQQYESFARYVNASREMQVNAMKMGARMFAPQGK